MPTDKSLGVLRDRPSTQGERVISDSDEFTAMSDPDFLAERKRVRETLEALAERYRVINIEFDRRAGIQWASASQA
jgi:hypothetical protein